jgi:DNA-binding XRE family transcriptional regulator
MAAARRVPLEIPPTTADEARLGRQEALLRQRVAKNLRAARNEAGLTQVQLGTRANLSPKYIGQAELGRRGVSIDFLARLAFCLGIDPANLLSE